MPEPTTSATRRPGQARHKLRSLRRLVPFLKPYRGRLLGAFAALSVAAAATLVLPVAVRRMIDLGFAASKAAHIDRYFLALFAVAVVLAVATAVRFYLVSWIGERVVADIRSAVYRHLLRMSPVFFETTRTGEVLSRLTTDTTLMQSVIGSGASIALRNAFLLLGGFCMLAVTSPRLTGLTVVLVPLALLPIIVFGRRVRRLSRSNQDRIADTSALAGETLNGIETVQALVQEQRAAQAFGTSVESAFATALRRIRARAWLTALVILIVFGAIVLVLWVGAQSVLEGRMSAGELGQFVLYAVIVAGSTGVLSEVWGELQRAAGAMERLGELLEAEPAIAEPAQPLPLPEPPRGEIAFERVHFCYPARPAHAALEDFSLRVCRGETVALVGPSGAGKTTVFRLLLRFYDPQGGRILLDGVDIARASPQAVRARIASVPQDTVIFAADALDNIRYGRPEASEAQVRAAARAALAEEFIERLPQGYRTFLGERGVRLSGGQRQRIAIARALLKDPPVLLLDEATSALDAESERLVQAALEQLMVGRTTLVIAHRLATVLKADRIVVMDGGRITAVGTHEELVNQEGIYARLAALQFGASALAGGGAAQAG